MNLVKLITDQLSGSVLGNLSSLLDADQESTQRAASAATPALLSALANLASTGDGAQTLSKVLGGLDPGTPGSASQLLGGNAASTLNAGTSLLGSLFSNTLISGLANSVSHFSGLGSGMVKKLLAYLAPLVLGKVASQWMSSGGGVQDLTNLFANQRDNIARAMPPGFSLADPYDETPRVHAPVREAPPKYASTKAPASMNWLVPAALALLGGFLLWQFMRPRADQAADVRTEQQADRVVAMKPELRETVVLPSVDVVRTDVTDAFASLNAALADVKDAASAERALPALRDVDAKLDVIQGQLARLPKTAMATLNPVIKEQAEGLLQHANTIDAIEGTSATFKTLLQDIISRITRWITSATN